MKIETRHFVVLLILTVAFTVSAPTADSASLSSSASLSPATMGPVAGRIVAISDIHGAFEELTSILQEVGLIDENLRWSGGDATLVETGDFTDRGPNVRECMDLLMRLQEEASEQGGEVIVLLGNHEAMNLLSFLRDTSPADFEAFVDGDSARRQEDAWQVQMAMLTKRAAALRQPEPVFNDAVRQSWEAKHPIGFVERMDAFGPDGAYGKWLRELPTAVQIDGILFMHAGLSPNFADKSVRNINREVRNEISNFDSIKRELLRRGLITPYATLDEMTRAGNDEPTRLRARRGYNEKFDSLSNANANWHLLKAEGFLWFRGLAEWPEDEGAATVAKILEKQDVSHIVVGHTRQEDGVIKSRFGGSVFIIDTGMLTAYFPGRPSALEIVDGRFTAIYLGERQQLLPVGQASEIRPHARVLPVVVGL